MTKNDEMYTITLTEKELGMLIEAANIMHIRYMRPGMTEAAKKSAPEYADLCNKLYRTIIEQDGIMARRTTAEKLKLMQEIERCNENRWEK